jgi:acetyl-CoA acyltransferase
LAKEIVPITVSQQEGKEIIVSFDEHPRRDCTLEKLAKLTPFRSPGVTVTARNSSGINDGAAALIASASVAKRFRMTPVARIVGGATAGVAPRLMEIGPVPATRKLCRIGLAPRTSMLSN